MVDNHQQFRLNGEATNVNHFKFRSNVTSQIILTCSRSVCWRGQPHCIVPLRSLALADVSKFFLRVLWYFAWYLWNWIFMGSCCFTILFKHLMHPGMYNVHSFNIFFYGRKWVKEHRIQRMQFKYWNLDEDEEVDAEYRNEWKCETVWKR